MILSMTGYGKGVSETPDRTIIIETRSVNSKSADISIRMPSELKIYEMEIRKKISQALIRGKIDVSINIEKHSKAIQNKIDTNIAKAYWEEIQRVHKETGIPLPNDPMRMVLTLPGIFINGTEEEADQSQDHNDLFSALDQALSAHTAFRKQEGQSLATIFIQNIEEIRQLLDQVAPFERDRIDNIRQKLEEGLKKYIDIEYDKNRLEQEMIYYIEKLDINEEKNRLSNHLSYFIQTLNNNEEAEGRKLGFIAQEIGREINTLGSKSNHSELQQIVVKMKDQLEQIKEQVLNIL